MGLFLNSQFPFEMYRQTVESPYFVDKTAMLSEVNAVIGTNMKQVCITRPRRFGKSITASMIGAYYGKIKDRSCLFDKLEISRSLHYKLHLNQHNVIYVDFSKVEDECNNYNSYITAIKEILKEDLHEAYPEIRYREKGSLTEDLLRIHEKTREKFIFVFDEWDAPFHMSFFSKADYDRYLLFLKNLLKDQPYVELAYMTGILPIAKYSSGSELNMFAEYTMASEEKYSEYFGFTEREVDQLYDKYLEINDKRNISREELRSWYNGYHTKTGERLYNPRSIVLALSNNNLGNYWTSSGPYDEIFYYIKHNIADVRDDIALMAAGESVTANIREYAAVSMSLTTRDEIFSAMVVYGFLTYENGKVSIPNKELMDKFTDMIRKEDSLGYVYQLAKESDQMLAATLSGDTKTMENILKLAHDTETSMLGYNNETELSAVIKLVYLSARDRYDVQREDKAGVGYVDYIFYPVLDTTADCIILELKINHTAEDAIQQIKDRNYAQRFIGKLGEKPKYTGRILAVGIGYEKDCPGKKHGCKVEVLRDAMK